VLSESVNGLVFHQEKIICHAVSRLAHPRQWLVGTASLFSQEIHSLSIGKVQFSILQRDAHLDAGSVRIAAFSFRASEKLLVLHSLAAHGVAECEEWRLIPERQ